MTPSRILIPPVWALLFLGVAFALHQVLPRYEIIPSAYAPGGAVPILLGMALMIWAVVVFRRAGTTHKPYESPTAFVAAGPYAFTRNPMYVGFVLILLGIAVFVGTAPMLFAPLAFFVAMNIEQIPREEKLLENLFGDAYLEFKGRVRRWI